jgi:hypothetical protein
LKHKLSQEWVSHWKDLDEAALEAEKYFLKAAKGTDTGVQARKFRGTISDANEETLEKFGIKLFVDDPVDLHTIRMTEMDHIVRNFDLMGAASKHAVVGTKPAKGWKQFDPSEFSDLVLIDRENPEVWKQFVPKFFKQANQDKKIWLPEAIHNRLAKNLIRKEIQGAPATLMKAMGAFNHIFRANALYGTGYLGLNMFSNATTYALTGSRLSSFADAAGVITDHTSLKSLLLGENLIDVAKKTAAKSITVLGDDGLKKAMTRQEIWEQALKHNVIGSGIQNVKLVDVFDNISTTAAARKKTDWWRPKSLADIGLLYRSQRNLAQYADDMPKLGVFIDRLKDGYTPAGAAEAAERAFFNYNNISSGMQVVRHVVPFSTFPVKTVEFAAKEFRDLRFHTLTVPQKALAALEGAYVPDQDTRDFLNEELPSYREFILDPVFGPLLPGGREVILELPFAKAALEALWNPLNNLHPFLEAVAGSAVARMLPTEEVDGVTNAEFRRGAARALDTIIPPPIRTVMALFELNGVVKWTDGFFSQKYVPTIPTESQTDINSLTAQKFDNAEAFGKYLEDNLADNFMYRFMFPEQLGSSLEDRLIWQRQITGARGEFIRKHFRQLTFGLGSMTSLDKNVMLHKYVIDRQSRDINAMISRKERRDGTLFASEKLTDKEFVKEKAKTDELYLEKVALDGKSDALHEIYNFLLGAIEFGQETSNTPDFDLGSLLFGMTDYQFDFSQKPDAMYKFLDRDKSKDLLWDKDAPVAPEDFTEVESDNSAPLED